MSTTEAAAESAAPAPIAAPVQLGGTVQDIRDALGFADIEDLPPDDRETAAPPADEVAAKRDEKATAKLDAKADAKPEKTDEEIVREIEARAKARRRERAESRRLAEAAATPKPAPQAPAAAEPAKPAEARAASPVESAVKDVLAQIAKLAGDDATAAAQSGGQAAPDTAERKEALAAITKKLDALTDGLKSTEEGKAKLDEVQAQLKALESERTIRRHAAKAIDAAGDEITALIDPKAIRAFNREHAKEYADGIEMVMEAAERYFEKFKVAPNMVDLAKRIEKKLRGPAAEKTDEKPTPTSKTVSRSDGSPPASRSGPDLRTYEEAMEDFNRKFGG